MVGLIFVGIVYVHCIILVDTFYFETFLISKYFGCKNNILCGNTFWRVCVRCEQFLLVYFLGECTF